MSYAYLATSTAGALTALNAKKPFARLGPVSVPSFFAGWLASELAPQAIVA